MNSANAKTSNSGKPSRSVPEVTFPLSTSHSYPVLTHSCLYQVNSADQELKINTSQLVKQVVSIKDRAEDEKAEI